MSIVNALKDAGFKAEVSTAGDKPILEGVYRCMFVDYKNDQEAKFGPQIMAAFKVVETMAGRDSRSTFPEFKGYFKTDEKNAASKRNGVAKLINGFFSVGVKVDTSSDEAFLESLAAQKGSAEVYIKGYAKQPMKNLGTEAEPNWVDDETKAPKQDFTFMTKANAEKEAKKLQKKAGHPL